LTDVAVPLTCLNTNGSDLSLSPVRLLVADEECCVYAVVERV